MMHEKTISVDSTSEMILTLQIGQWLGVVDTSLMIALYNETNDDDDHIYLR